MKTIKHIIMTASLATAALGLTGCAGMSQQDKNTAIGAVLGGALTGGSAAGTVGGAAVGGVIGNQVKSTH
jgi:osmotically inducible lipoprotein OsmB